MVGQASSLSIRVDGQDARPTGNPGFGGALDCFASLAMTISCKSLSGGFVRRLNDHCSSSFNVKMSCFAES
jgi:hypothetical protein